MTETLCHQLIDINNNIQINTKLINNIQSKVSELISNLPKKYYASVLNYNIIKIKTSIYAINNDMHSIKINDYNTIIIYILKIAKY